MNSRLTSPLAFIKPLLAAAFLFLCIQLQAQEKPEPTSSFEVQGDIQHPYKITLDSISSRPAQSIGDLVITNHMGVTKNTAKELKGVLLKSLLANAELSVSNPKLFSEYYIVCVASDGYKVVFSWNELFNSPTGDHAYVVTSKDGNALAAMSDRILLAVTTDQKTGRRFLKGLSKVIFKRVSE